MTPYTPPEFRKSAFNCPLCGAYADQRWQQAYFSYGSGSTEIKYLGVCYCNHCQKYTVWRAGKMISPVTGNAPLPNPDLPDEVKEDYEEARSIVAQSPRGAAALLRLTIQKLCAHLGEKGKDINKDIGSLVKKGLAEKIQQALDVVRVVGNNAVHPGQIDLNDNPEIASNLFMLVNMIAEQMITQPKHVDDLFEALPEGAKNQIEERDKET